MGSASLKSNSDRSFSGWEDQYFEIPPRLRTKAKEIEPLLTEEEKAGCNWDADYIPVYLFQKGGINEAVDFLIGKYRFVIWSYERKYFLPRSYADDLSHVLYKAFYDGIKNFKYKIGKSGHPVRFVHYIRICLHGAVVVAIRSANGPQSMVNEMISLDQPFLDHDRALIESLAAETSHQPCLDDEIPTIQALYARLSAHEKIVADHLIEGRRFTEIAALTGLSLKSVDNASYKIRTKLKLTLDEHKMSTSS